MTHIYEQSFIVGFGNEMILAGGFTMIVLLLLLYLLGRSRFSSGRTQREFVLREEIDQPPVIFNVDETCSICLSHQQLSVETNCGHIFCGVCLISVYEHLDYRILLCPICRQQVTMVFHYFTEEEVSSVEIAQTRTTVRDFITVYNRRFSLGDRSISDFLLEIPILLRHLWNDFFTLNGLLRNRIRIRILICVISATIYLLVPTDAVPEAVFGILGLIDDFVVVSFVVYYLCVTYRNIVANGNVDLLME